MSQASDPKGARHFLTERLQQGQPVILPALQYAAGVGFTQLYPAFSSVDMRAIWILNDLFVTEAARRRGVASLLMQEARLFAIRSDAALLVLATATDNHPAQMLYEKLGWVRDTAFVHYKLEI